MHECEKNKWDDTISTGVKEGPADCITIDEVAAALKTMKSYKAPDLSAPVAEMIQATGILKLSRYRQANTNKTKVMIREECQKLMQKAARWPCGVSGEGVGSNSIQCISCQKWVHKKCSDTNGSMSRGMKSFMCRGCLNTVTTTGCTCQCKSGVSR